MSTVTGWVKAELELHAFGPPSMLHAGGMGAPLMVWPHVALLPVVASKPLQVDGPEYGGLNGLPASPGNTEM